MRKIETRGAIETAHRARGIASRCFDTPSQWARLSATRPPIFWGARDSKGAELRQLDRADCRSVFAAGPDAYFPAFMEKVGR
ncbi:hypothetical protein [Xanthomonas hortorum]|uniref:hypothetical protein n=1 Tax=Xanthomonas hortorum TaxID=56454 RepID=UPI0035B524FE